MNHKSSLAYEPESNFQGCSQDAKELLEFVREKHDIRTAQRCTYALDVLSGKEKLKKKNGELPNIKGLRSFAEKHCH